VASNIRDDDTPQSHVRGSHWEEGAPRSRWQCESRGAPWPGTGGTGYTADPPFPDRFGAIQDVRAHCNVFFAWYNTEHHHSGLGLLTPSDVHHGLAEQRVAARATVLAAAYAAHPERFPGGLPQPPELPVEVWINPPKPPGRTQASARTQPSDLPTRAPSRSLPSIAAQS
jgi:hypothetical protein